MGGRCHHLLMISVLNGGLGMNLADGHMAAGLKSLRSRLGPLLVRAGGFWGSWPRLSAFLLLSFPCWLHHLQGARAVCEALSNAIPPFQSRPQAAVSEPQAEQLFSLPSPSGYHPRTTPGSLGFGTAFPGSCACPCQGGSGLSST